MTTPFGKPASEEDFSIDTADAKSNDIVPGQYVGKVVDIVKTKAKESGNPMWEWTFVITEGDYAGKDRKLWTVITPTALWKLNETLAALGFKPEAGETIIKFKKADAINRGCVLDCVEEDRRGGGGKSVNVKRILPHPKGAGFLIKKKGPTG